VEFIVILAILCVVFRVTAAIAFVVLVLLYLFYPLHGSRRALMVSYVMVAVALLIPVDIQVPGFHSSVEGNKRIGLRFVRVTHGLLVRPEARKDRDEFLAGGCIVGIHPVRWILVWK
jgi:hypothetical protein